MALTLLVFLIIGFSISLRRKRVDYIQFGLWLTVFSLYLIFMLITNSYIIYPYHEFYVSSDQLTFYPKAMYFGNQNFARMTSTISQMIADQPRMAYWVHAVWVKLGMRLGVEDMQLFLKLRVVFIGSVIPVVMYKITRLYMSFSWTLFRRLLIFSLCTPLFSYSVQIMRDIDIALLYTLIVYLSLNKHIRFRYGILAILIVITSLFRLESGLYATVFPFISIVNSIEHKSSALKFGVVIFLLAIVAVYLPSMLSVADETLTGYSHRGAEAASSTSMGMAIWNRLGPLSPFVKVLFTEMLPFPVWLPILDTEAYGWTRIIETIWGFYWLPIFVTLLLGWWKFRKILPQDFRFFLYAALAYLVLNAMGEFNPRRMMAVYPLMYVLYLRLRTEYHMGISKVGWTCSWTLIALNGIYYLLK